ncbi:TPA: orotidine 5'-phosphate decarboxylase [Candidatus Bathyarchaeota archaeon]|nr:orotidine 5'-phosphate decarboxylase [Candidatus Bathyarchaeota archaeon]
MVALSFKKLMEESEEKRGSNIILALDSVPSESGDLLSISLKILEKTHPYVCAVKLNRHLLLPLGLYDGVKRIVEKAHSLDLPVIMDCKINDIGYTNRVIAENYFNAGFDAVIANPFVGWEEGLQPVFEVAREMKRGVILLVYMSHKSSWEGYGQTIYDSKTGKKKLQYVAFAEKALAWKADGAVVGGTYPEKIREVYAILKEKVPIYSPGIGAQGGNIKAAVSSGARYLIIGRAITLAGTPEEAARFFRDIVKLS